jgi:hypothetical protein
MYKNPTDVFINLASGLDTVMALSKAFAKDRVRERAWGMGMIVGIA